MYKYLILVFVGLTLFSCRSMKIIAIGNINYIEDNTNKVSKKFKYNNATKDPLSYAPYDENDQWNYIRKVRVNVHFMHDSTSMRNIPEENAEKYAWSLINLASDRLLKNKQMNLPVGNTTPILMPHYKYFLYPNNKDAVHIHHDNDLYYYVDKGKNKNNYNRAVINKYAVNEDSILNIFVIPHHPDSIESKKYPGHKAGIAMGHSLKISGNFHDRKVSAWELSPILNHEIGHILGLNHSWIRNDGCDDTPPHANCYGESDKPPCNKGVSNNMMDYNGSEVTLTPCQIGKIHQKIANLKSRQRSLIVQDWCQLDTSRVIIITDSIKWEGSKDLSHNITIMPGGVLEISSRISFPKGASIYVSPGGTLTLDNAHLHNACGDLWNGIVLASKGKNKSIVNYKNRVLIENVYEEIKLEINN